MDCPVATYRAIAPLRRGRETPVPDYSIYGVTVECPSAVWGLAGALDWCSLDSRPR
jgi:hypothetical protein